MQFLVATGRCVGGYVLEHAGHRVTDGVAALAMQGRCDVPYVVALVAVGGKHHALATQFEVTQVDARCKDIHLAAGIVHIVFTMHLEADGGEQVGDGGAVGGTAAMTDMQRPGRVGGNEFHLYALACAKLAAAELAALLQCTAYHAVPGIAAEVEVDEAGARDLDLRHAMVGLHRTDQLFCQVARFAARRF